MLSIKDLFYIYRAWFIEAWEDRPFNSCKCCNWLGKHDHSKCMHIFCTGFGG